MHIDVAMGLVVAWGRVGVAPHLGGLGHDD